MSTCDCFSGSRGDDNYKPAGAFSTVAGLQVYRSSPKTGTEPRRTILYLPDGFGLATHNLMLADRYAEHGFDTIIVDYFEGEALPDIFMQYTPGTDIESYTNFTPEQKEIIRKIDMPAWQSRHTPAHVSSLLDTFFPELCNTLLPDLDRREGLHVVGHCFGGKHALRFAKTEEIKSAVIFHPAFLDSGDTTGLKRPVFMGCAETDIFTPTLIQDMMKQLPRSGARYKFLVYGGTKHGFASRADAEDEHAIRILKEAFDDSVRWMQG